jgi:hypothetical protein
MGTTRKNMFPGFQKLTFYNDFIINYYVHRFILDRTFVDFTVSLLILPFDIVDFNKKDGKINNQNRKINGFMV